MKGGLPADFVAYEDFLARARKVLPEPVYVYLQAGIGPETGIRRNRTDLDSVLLAPRANGDPNEADPAITLFGRSWSHPFAVAPVGMPGLICPGSEATLARAATDIGIPFSLSTVASVAVEDIASIAGANLWFQLYPSRLDEVRQDLIARAGAAGCEVMMVTVDIPAGQRRERAMRSGVDVPVRFAPLIRAAPRHPRWVMRMVRGPRPALRGLAPYFPNQGNPSFHRSVSQRMTRPFGPREIVEVRKAWSGTLLVKGILDPRSAAEMVAAGADGIIVSNHGGRQLDAAPSPVRALPAIRQALGPDVPLLADSGATSGLDILRLLRLGANMVLLGKYPYAAVGACGRRAARPALDIICHQIQSVMMQLGIRRVAELGELGFRTPASFDNEGV